MVGQGYTPSTLITPGQLHRALTEIRRTGIAYQREELDLGLMSVAAPVTDAAGTVVAALSVVLRSSRYKLQYLTPAVRTAAASASREMCEHNVRGVNPERMLQMLDGRASDDPSLGLGRGAARPWLLRQVERSDEMLVADEGAHGG
jgi:hypothetical protein